MQCESARRYLRSTADLRRRFLCLQRETTSSSSWSSFEAEHPPILGFLVFQLSSVKTRERDYGKSFSRERELGSAKTGKEIMERALGERESFGGRMRFWWGFSKQTSIHGKSFRGEREREF